MTSNTSILQKCFPQNRFGAMRDQFERGRVDKAYHLSLGEGALELNLEIRGEVVAWATKVVATHPKLNVII